VKPCGHGGGHVYLRALWPSPGAARCLLRLPGSWLTQNREDLSHRFDQDLHRIGRTDDRTRSHPSQETFTGRAPNTASLTPEEVAAPLRHLPASTGPPVIMIGGMFTLRAPINCPGINVGAGSE